MNVHQERNASEGSEDDGRTVTVVTDEHGNEFRCRLVNRGNYVLSILILVNSYSASHDN